VRAAEATATGHPSGDERYAVLDTALKRVRFGQDQLIEVLHVAQELFGYLPDEVLRYVGTALRLPPSHVVGVATFYHLFTFEPPGEHTCSVCTGTACYVKGADAIVAALSREHDVAPGGTTEDGSFTLRTVRCVGSCSLAPVAVVDGHVTGNLDAGQALLAVRATLAAEVC
jgi:bidirectional [NiFe] hydrogenase diaphorase subunit